MTDPIDLIGKHIDDGSVTTFLAGHGGPHTVDEFDEDPAVDRYVTSATSGVVLSLDKLGFVEAVFLYLHGHEEKPEFQGRLPLGLSKDLTQASVRRLLGEPTFQRSATVDPLLGPYGPAERYDLASRSVHLEYAVHTGKLSLVTVMAASAVPGLPEGNAGTTRH